MSGIAQRVALLPPSTPRASARLPRASTRLPRAPCSFSTLPRFPRRPSTFVHRGVDGPGRGSSSWSWWTSSSSPFLTAPPPRRRFSALSVPVPASAPPRGGGGGAGGFESVRRNSGGPNDGGAAGVRRNGGAATIGGRISRSSAARRNSRPAPSPPDGRRKRVSIAVGSASTTTSSSGLPPPLHPYASSSSLLPSEPAAVSDAQRRTASLELERMERSTARILSVDISESSSSTLTPLPLPLSEAGLNEVRVALHYWSRRWYMHFHPRFGRAAKGAALTPSNLSPLGASRGGTGSGIGDRDISGYGAATAAGNVGRGVVSGGDRAMGGDYGARKAEQILDWILAHDRSVLADGSTNENGDCPETLLSRGAFDSVPGHAFHERDLGMGGSGGSPNAAWTNVVETYLLPFGSDDTTTSTERAGGGLREADSAGMYGVIPSVRVRARALVDATRVLKKITDLRRRTGPDGLFADALSASCELNIWFKRSLLLGEVWKGGGRDVGNSDHDGAGGGGRIRGDKSAAELLRRLEAEDTQLHGTETYDDDAYALRGCLERMEKVLSDAENQYLQIENPGSNTDQDKARKRLLEPIFGWYNHLMGAYARSSGDFHASGDGSDALRRNALAKNMAMLRGMEEFEDVAAPEEEDEAEFPSSSSVFFEGIVPRPCWAAPDVVSYNTALFCLARSFARAPPASSLHRGRDNDRRAAGGHPTRDVDDERTRAAKIAQALLRRMEARAARRRGATPASATNTAAAVRPDAVTFGTVLHVLARAGMAREAEEILESLEDGYGARLDGGGGSDCEEREATIVPNATMYNSVLNAWAKSSDPRASLRAESLLNRMESLGVDGKNPLAEPDTVSVSSVISCHARSRTAEGAERAEALLERAMELYRGGNAKVKPDAIMYNSVISAWASCSGTAGANKKRNGETQDDATIPTVRAERVLKMLKELQHEPGLNVRPIVQTYNILLDCWAKNGMEGSTERAVSILEEMKHEGVAPDQCTYNSILNAIFKERGIDWIDRAQKIFEEMKDLRDAGKISFDTITYHTMMNMYGKSSVANGAEKADELLRKMKQDGVSPNSVSYNICIDAYARRGNNRDNLKKAEGFLEEMLSLSEKQGMEQCRPTIHSFASVVNALAKSGKPDAAERAEEIVRKVEALDYVSPNTILLNSAIDCICRSRAKGSARRAENILRKMEKNRLSGNTDVCPDSRSYSLVLTCWARSREEGAAERAESILMHMEELYDSGFTDIVANNRCYSAAITAWARSGSANAVDKALSLLDRIEKKNRDGNPLLRPNAYCYNAVINTIAKSKRPRKAKLCNEVLSQMIQAQDSGFEDAAPSLITYSTIINACAYIGVNASKEEKAEAFDIARSCFRSLMEVSNTASPGPFASAFAHFLLAIARLVEHGEMRDQLADAVFREGCKRGIITRSALVNLLKASPLVAERLVPSDFLSPNGATMPTHWCCNIDNDYLIKI